MAGKSLDEPPNHELSRCCDFLLELSLPDNPQTWLYCLPGSDPNYVCDLTEFLTLKSEKFSSVLAEDCNTRSHAINTRTFTRQKKQGSYGNGKKQITYLNKHINPDGACSIQEKASTENILIQSSPTVQTSKTLTMKNEDLMENDKVKSSAVDRTTSKKTTDSMNNNIVTNQNNISNSWEISDRTLLFDISAPKVLMESTFPSVMSDSMLKHNNLSFIPNSFSTPTKTLIGEEKNKYTNCNTGNKDDIPININNNTFESRANHTFNILEADNKNNDINDNLNLNITHIILTSKVEFETPVDDIDNGVKQNNILQDTFVVEDSNENVGINSNDPKPLSVDYEGDKHAINNKSDDQLNYPYDAVTDLNSTVIIKSKDHDSEQDSCYSSSSNLRSLSDVCAMSQLQPQKSSNLDSKLKKARSEDFLCLAQNTECKIQPEKPHGSALNLAPQWTSGEKCLKKPNYLKKNFEKLTGQANVSLLDNVSKHNNEFKAPTTRRLSKIPRPQSRIPKLSLKKV